MQAHSGSELVWSTAPGDPALLLDAGTDPGVQEVEELLARGPVAVTLGGGDAGALALASVYAWLGVSAFRFPGDTGELRQVLDMVASIRGERPPALARRALA